MNKVIYVKLGRFNQSWRVYVKYDNRGDWIPYWALPTFNRTMEFTINRLDCVIVALYPLGIID